MEEPKPIRVRCQRIACNATFTVDDNPEGSCQYHDSGPIFHDGMKVWSCCKKKSHDFTLFLEIPGCKTGQHTTEKPVIAKPAPSPKIPVPSSANASSSSAKESCSRCRQGFFCSDHGSQAKVIIVNPRPENSATAPSPVPEQNNIVPTPAEKKIVVGINEPQICKNKGCGQTFKEKDNHDAACNYHPGPPVFHDRNKGWKCCDVHVKEFDEFVNIPPCAKGWHNADAS